MLRILSALYYIGLTISSTPKEGFTSIRTFVSIQSEGFFFSHFIEMSYSRSVINEIFLLSTFQVFHKMSIKSLETLLKNSCFCHYVCSCESKPILFAGYLLSVRITQPRGALQFSETLTFHHRIGSLMDVDSNNNLIKLFSADKI